jgi:competence protein ComEA
LPDAGCAHSPSVLILSQTKTGPDMYWKDYLYFTRSQRNGIKSLLLLILILVISPTLYRRLVPVSPVDPGAFRQDVQAFADMLETRQEASGDTDREGSGSTQSPPGEDGAGTPGGSGAEDSQVRLHPVAFDPNALSAEEWEAMGIPAYAAKSIVNYRKAGGSFRYREDLQRIYLMADDWYRQLEPHIQLPARKEADHRAGDRQEAAHGSILEGGAETGPGTKGARSGNGSATTEVRSPIDLNRADTTLLMDISGIGPVFSRRIYLYRELLGGYCHPDQLLEVYGMDSARWVQVKPQVIIDTTEIRQMNLNEIPYEDLLRHPYIDRNLASSLIGIRDQHGPLHSREQVRRSFLVDDEVYRRIAPYLKAD